jgi:hypothetical protein
MPPSLSAKLQLKPGQRLALLNLPKEGAIDLDGVPIAAERASTDGLLVFVTSLAEVKKQGFAAAHSMPPGGLFWIAYPKGTSRTKRDVNRDVLREAMLPTGWHAVRLIALDATWSAMRFRTAYVS